MSGWQEPDRVLFVSSGLCAACLSASHGQQHVQLQRALRQRSREERPAVLCIAIA